MGKVQDFLKSINLKHDQYHTVLDYLKIDWHKTRFVPTDQQFEQVRKIVQEHGTGFVLAKWIKEQNSLEKYGVTSPNKLKEKREKSSKTIKEKIAQGIRFGGNVKGCNSLSVDEKQKRKQELKQISKDRWGENYQDLSTGEKIAITCKKRDSHKNQVLNRKKLIINDYPGYVYFNEYFEHTDFMKRLLEKKLISHYKTIPFLGNIVLKSEVETIPVQNDYIHWLKGRKGRQTSVYEIDLGNFLKNDLNLEVVQNNRKILPQVKIKNPGRQKMKRIELDIFVPEYQLAVELNGLYWHSNKYKQTDYHLIKTKLCDKQEIQLLQFFQDEWLQKTDLCKNLIKLKCNKISNIIKSEDCEFSIINSIQGIKFLECNHIQPVISKENSLFYGLVYHSELIQVIQVQKTRNITKLLRLGPKVDYSVIGGLEKLLKYQPFDNLITFIDRRLFTKQPYLKAGFEFIKNTKPKSFYTKQGQKIRMKNWKDYCKNIDFGKTPQENLENNKFYKVYDCGCIKMQWKRS